MTPANAFETHVGRFWGLLSTRDYMRARFALASQLLLLATPDGVLEGLEHMRAMLMLGGPPVTRTANYDWGDMTLPYLNIRGADVLEDPGFHLGDYPELNYLVALLLPKLKLLVDIRNLKVTRKVLAQRLPFELRDQMSELKLLNHARQLGCAFVETNGNFVFNLFDPDEALSYKPDSYSRGSLEEMALAMQNSYATWWETEGVLDLLNDARACAARGSENEIGDMMQNERIRQGRTAAELLADVSVNRIWGYLDYAVENASYLGPWPERPTEWHTKENREAWARAVAEEAEEAEPDDSSNGEAWSDDED
ncbi:hypothetical protein F5B21DRAFT_523937 [Xylaria acuta]|nr:hypothetical protein F5B21DRAFT_523937 [Xylaria acuta]